MELLIAAAVFVTITFASYAALQLKAGSVGGTALDERLGTIRSSRPRPEPLVDPDASFGTRVVQPLVRGLTRKVNSLLPSNMEQRLEAAIEQAGLKIQPGQIILLTSITAGVLPVVLTLLMLSGGQGFKMLLLVFFGGIAIGIYGPRLWLLGRIKRRQKEIWRSLPDAFDLVTASVEAGLGVDASFQRVVEKTHGPFGDELGRTLREIQMGRSRREALTDLANRTGVDELRSFLNAIIQAETMGVSIGTVIRVQTGVLRTKRRQKAEEQAFKAPIKMVFPLVFFIFPAIMVVIGGPAVIQLRDAGW